jgi:cyclopropane fatty-acyl-phospholipid synthase-like methyltransferase
MHYHVTRETKPERYLRTFRAEQISNLGGIILDAGCSHGLTTLHLAELNPASIIVGMDRDKNRIDAARCRTPIELQGRVKFEIGDFYQLNGEYDSIFTMNNLIFAMSMMTREENRNIFKSIYHALRPNGRWFLGQEYTGAIFHKHPNHCFTWGAGAAGFHQGLAYLRQHGYLKK